jgi:hypothetical protein
MLGLATAVFLEMSSLRNLAAGMGLALLTLSVGQTARAAQDTTVVVDNAPIRSEPKSNASILEYLSIGTEVRVSSFPMEGGWYKVRSKTGLYGWLNEKFLSVYKAPNKDGELEAGTGPKPERDRKFYFRFFGGYDFFRPDDLNSVFAFHELNTGTMFGTEAGMFISERVSVAFRGEILSNNVVAKESQSQIFFNLGLRSYPVMGGFDFHFIKLPAMRLSLGIFGGVALATSFSSEASSLAAPNVMVLQRSPFTTLARLNLTRPLGRILSVFIEGGYRYLRTDEIDTTAASGINGGPQVYAKDGVYRTRTIDLSGLELGVGLGVHF